MCVSVCEREGLRANITASMLSTKTSLTSARTHRQRESAREKERAREREREIVRERESKRERDRHRARASERENHTITDMDNDTDGVNAHTKSLTDTFRDHKGLLFLHSGLLCL